MFLCRSYRQPKTGKLLEYQQLIKMKQYVDIWTKSFVNELGQLTKGIRDIRGTDTIKSIPPGDMPAEKPVMYSRIVVDYQPQKIEPNRTRLTVGGDRLDFPWNTSTPTAELEKIYYYTPRFQRPERDSSPWTLKIYTSKHHLPFFNICDCTSTSSRTRSSKPTVYVKLQTISGHTCALSAACTSSKRQASLPTNFSPKVSPNAHANLHPPFGATYGDPSYFPLTSTILASNARAYNTQST